MNGAIDSFIITERWDKNLLKEPFGMENSVFWKKHRLIALYEV